VHDAGDGAREHQDGRGGEQQADGDVEDDLKEDERGADPVRKPGAGTPPGTALGAPYGWASTLHPPNIRLA